MVCSQPSLLGCVVLALRDQTSLVVACREFWEFDVVHGIFVCCAAVNYLQ